MFDAKYFEKQENDIICKLCPYECNLSNSKTGKCKVRINVKGILKTLNYSKLTAVAIDPIEKKPLFHFYPGSNTLSVGSFGCNLSCKHCQNQDIANVNYTKYTTYDIFPETLIQIAKDKNSKIISYTYNEPIVFIEYILDSAKLARENNIKNCFISNGFINKKPLLDLISEIDAFNIDIKAFNQKFYDDICGGYLKNILDNVKLI